MPKFLLSLCDRIMDGEDVAAQLVPAAGESDAAAAVAVQDPLAVYGGELPESIVVRVR